LSSNNLDLDLVGSPVLATGVFGEALLLDNSSLPAGRYGLEPLNSVFSYSNGNPLRDFSMQIWVRFETPF